MCMFVVRAEHRDNVLIKSNSVNLSNGCNQLPQCALSSVANGCSAICYVDRYTHTSEEKWISGNKDPLFFTPPLNSASPYDVNRLYITPFACSRILSVSNRSAGAFLRNVVPGTKRSYLYTLVLNLSLQSEACSHVTEKQNKHTSSGHDQPAFFLPPFSSINQVLHCCVSGSNLHTQQSHYLLSLSDLSNEYDLMLGQVKSFEPPPSQMTTADFGNLLTVAEGKDATIWTSMMFPIVTLSKRPTVSDY